jgi:hypothetical protein
MNIWQFLFYTILIEIPILLIFYYEIRKDIVLVCVLGNLFTWPLLTLLFIKSGLPLLWLEVGVFIIEWTIYALFFPNVRSKAAPASLLANGCSFLIGLWWNDFQIPIL